MTSATDLPPLPHAAPAAALSGLRGVALLQGLDDEVLAEVARACRFQLVRARQTVMTRDDAEHDCCFVLSGRLRVMALSPGGRELSFRDAAAGETLGEMAALDGRPRSATVVALQESLLARIRPRDLAALLQAHWPVCERMLRHLAGTARALTERVYELSTLSVPQRLCAELLRGAMAGERIGAARVVLRPAPSHGELAMRISCLREQVARAMAELARRGVVRRASEPEPGPVPSAEDEPRRARVREVLVIEDLHRLAECVEGVERIDSGPVPLDGPIDITLCAGAQGCGKPAA